MEKRLVTVLVAVVAFSTVASASVVWSMSPYRDTFIDTGSTSPKISDPNLRSRFGSTTDCKKFYMQFQITDPDYDPNTAVLVGATLRLSARDPSGNNGKAIQFWGLDDEHDDWPDDMIWSTSGDYGNDLVGVQGFTGASALTGNMAWGTDEWTHTYDLSDYLSEIQAFIAAGSGDDLFTLVSYPVGTMWVKSQDFVETETQFRPLLTLEWDPIPEPAALSVLAVGLGGLLVRRRR